MVSRLALMLPNFGVKESIPTYFEVFTWRFSYMCVCVSHILPIMFITHEDVPMRYKLFNTTINMWLIVTHTIQHRPTLIVTQLMKQLERMSHDTYTK